MRYTFCLLLVVLLAFQKWQTDRSSLIHVSDLGDAISAIFGRPVLGDANTSENLSASLSLKRTRRAKDADSNSHLEPALSCLRLTTPHLKLQYPLDAIAHLSEIGKTLTAWGANRPPQKPYEGSEKPYAGWSGPWIEDTWMQHSADVLKTLGSDDNSLRTHFGPFIPLLIPFLHIWITSGNRYPSKFVDALESVLRPEVPYITVSQNDRGMDSGSRLSTLAHTNILVLSAGGYGHVPIPLFIREIQPPEKPKPMGNRTYLVSYMGSMGHANDLRPNMKTRTQSLSKDLGFKSYFGFHKNRSKWIDVMRDSKVSLCPRGYGRSSFHIVEALQLGLIPVHVYRDLDIEWIPYRTLFTKFGFSCSEKNVGQFVERIAAMSDTELEEREALIRRMHRSHFTQDGVVEQIEAFMTGNSSSDLECQKLPQTVR